MPPSYPRIFLIGPMGSGKTSIGRHLADLLGLRFFDCDDAIVERTGASINLIFDIEGEAGFRERESAMLAELAAQKEALIATGGGAVLSAANRALLRSSGFVIWLKTSVEQQARRLRKDQKRPLLQFDDWRQRLERLAKERDPLYGETADLVFESSQRSVPQAARLLHEALLEQWASEGTKHATH